MTTPALTPPLPAELRAELLALVQAELHGPAGGDTEELTEPPRERYLVGMLAPRKQREGIDPAVQDDLDASAGSEASDDSAAERSVSQAPSMFPSSMGLTCCIDGSATHIAISATWGHYTRGDSATLRDAQSGAPLKVWQREPRGSSTTVALHDGNLDTWHPIPGLAVVVRGVVRRRANAWIVSLFLVNEQIEPEKRRDSAWLFQPELSLRDPNDAPIFRRRAPDTSHHRTPEARALAMRHRHQVEFAVGHGVSVHADADPAEPTRATRVATRVAPVYELPPTTFAAPDEHARLAGMVLDMRTLAEAPAEELPALLTPLVDAYHDWITAQRARIESDTSLAPYRADAEAALHAAGAALLRIQAGIDLLTASAQTAAAFQFMNRAMWQQRIHTLAADRARNQQPVAWDTIDVPGNRSWRLFQLAFILLNLPALSDPHHPDRSSDPAALADLLWFPTGGGKTEAYLGLTAYTLAIRRLQGTLGGRDGSDGVAVLMRYTLRLLTLQQFQRAAALLCACEVLRRDAPALWGSAPFRIGLWVGQRTTPNTTEQSNEALNRAHGQTPRASTVGGSGTPHQLTACPWCGAPIETKHITVDRTTRRTITYCGDPQGDCPFSARQAPREGLPVLVVDEDIYRRLPSLLIATVDKFAQLPWNGATQLLFGQTRRYCERHGFLAPDLDECGNGHKASTKHGLPAARVVERSPLRPPDLIIQDELHLMNGPLGTLAGLYETAVDRLASWDLDGKRVRPKVVASTATVRQATEQVHALFLRGLAVFPPPALDADDTFFARQREPTQEQPGRLYLGICAPGKRQKAVLIRVYVAFLAAAQTLYERVGQHADPWMTLVGYFNTMRELGGMRRLVDDDVRSRLRKIDQHGLARRTAPLRLEELTSRKGATDIPAILALLETPFDPQTAQQRAAGGAPRTLPTPLDVLLATNMISVGVDVRRLGLMVVSGQPKTTAEYIQATSRVGRTTPGLVCTIFNWARPRDLSHYEQFEHYHATFYQHVEALSVTPFSARAIDRGLSALLVALVRLTGTEYNANTQAGRLRAPHPYLDAALSEIPARAALVSGQQAVADQVRAALQQRIDRWLKEVQRPTSGRTLAYQRTGQTTVELLKKPEEHDWETFTCLNSLRDVEPMVALWMTAGPLGSEVGQGYRAYGSSDAPDSSNDDENDNGEER